MESPVYIHYAKVYLTKFSTIKVRCFEYLSKELKAPSATKVILIFIFQTFYKLICIILWAIFVQLWLKRSRAKR